MPNQGDPGSALNCRDCTDRPLVRELTWIGGWVVKKWSFMLWSEGKKTWPAQDTNVGPTCNPWIFFLPCPKGTNGWWQYPATNCCLGLSGVPQHNSPCRQQKRRSPLAVTTLHCTLDTDDTQQQSMASACYCSSTDGVAIKLSLQDWEMVFFVL